VDGERGKTISLVATDWRGKKGRGREKKGGRKRRAASSIVHPLGKSRD